jgi:hypothetical protein
MGSFLSLISYKPELNLRSIKTASCGRKSALFFSFVSCQMSLNSFLYVKDLNVVL